MGKRARDVDPEALKACRCCGREITPPRYPNGALHPLSRRVPFCSPLCATAALLEAQALGQAVVKLSTEGVTCLLCGKGPLEIAGTHFLRVHGMPKTSSRTELQLKLGLPQGTRLASARILNIRADAMRLKGTPPNFLGASRAMGNGSRQNKVRAPRGMGQLAAWSALRPRLKAYAIEQGAERAEAARVHPWQCKRCGKEELTNAKGALRVYCDMDCRSPGVDWQCANPACGKRQVAEWYFERKRRFCSIECRSACPHEGTLAVLREEAVKRREASITRDWVCKGCGRQEKRAAHGLRVKYCGADCRRLAGVKGP